MLLKEQKRNSDMIEIYKKEIESLPKGNLSAKNIRNNEYYYLKYREGKRIVTDYIGKNADAISFLRKQIQKRKHCEGMLIALFKEQKAILRMLEGLD